MATISVTLTPAQEKAIELLKNDSSATVASIVKAQAVAFANAQVRQVLQNAVQGGVRNSAGEEVVTQLTDEEISALFEKQFLTVV